MVIRCAVVDDDQIDLQKISKVFLELSHETSLEFKNEYLECFDVNNARNFDLFVLDIDMPDINGFHRLDQYGISCLPPDACGFHMIQAIRYCPELFKKLFIAQMADSD